MNPLLFRGILRRLLGACEYHVLYPGMYAHPRVCRLWAGHEGRCQ